MIGLRRPVRKWVIVKAWLMIKITCIRGKMGSILLPSLGENVFIKYHIPIHIYPLSLEIVNFPPLLPMWIPKENTFVSSFTKLITCSRLIVSIAQRPEHPNMIIRWFNPKHQFIWSFKTKNPRRVRLIR